ncbi:DUF3800 domain-containing protein [Micromonospora echinaurantiaca]|uniref:DUF3800 domain-containing protein n=1 Tax=Micromonospora echinaurantiaca TaxID=47857 RepID=UPI003716C4EA
MKLYMDESGNGNASQPLIVGAVEIDEDPEEIEQRIQELYRRLSARWSLDGLPSFEEFRKKGFHASGDPVEVSGPFRELMQDLAFRVYLVLTDRTDARAGDTEVEKLGFMYEHLLGDLLIRHRERSELLCFIEQNDSIRQLVSNLPESAVRRAHGKLGRATALPQLKIVMAAKTEAMSMAIIDYIMMFVSRWVRSGRITDPTNRDYRAFREVEPFISVLYSLEHGLISSRKLRLH